MPKTRHSDLIDRIAGTGKLTDLSIRELRSIDRRIHADIRSIERRLLRAEDRLGDMTGDLKCWGSNRHDPEKIESIALSSGGIREVSTCVRCGGTLTKVSRGGQTIGTPSYQYMDRYYFIMKKFERAEARALLQARRWHNHLLQLARSCGLKLGRAYLPSYIKEAV